MIGAVRPEKAPMEGGASSPADYPSFDDPPLSEVCLFWSQT